MAKSTGYSSRGSKFNSEHPQSSITPVPRDPIPSYVPLGQQVPGWCTDVQAGKTPAHIKKKKKKLKSG